MYYPIINGVVTEILTMAINENLNGKDHFVIYSQVANTSLFPNDCWCSHKHIYFMAELVYGEMEHSDWLPDRSIFCCTDC